MKSIIVTCALPYANGELHLGHMMEYVQADIFVRAMRLKGNTVHFICAEDTHGTPIETKAIKQNIRPEELIARMRESHVKDFEDYNIGFDEFYTTHSDENREYAEKIFLRLKENGYITVREIEQLYCENDNRFLPDRFIKGECPYCNTKDQYGDICEACGRTYGPKDLKDAYCVLCGKKPIISRSTHYFFELSKCSEEIRDYIHNKAILQKETRNYVNTWIDKGLQDWDITRDGPYFGFKIPGETNKYFYVWLDAPIGYLSSLDYYKQRTGIEKDLWQDSHIIHIIGKDIMYFHLLFWPAILMHSGYKVPEQIQVHGFLNYNGEKMSKSRGTFVLAHDMTIDTHSDLMRYYIASQLNSTINDIDYNPKEFQNRINHELISNIMNMHYRIGSLIEKKKTKSVLDDRTEGLHQAILDKHKEFLEYISVFEHSRAVRTFMEMGDSINKYIQDNKPWTLEDPGIILGNAYYAALMTLPSMECIMPHTANKIAVQYGVSLAYISEIIGKNDDVNIILSELSKLQKNESLTVNAKIIYKRLEVDGASQKNKSNTENENDEIIPYDKLSLKVAKIAKANDHPNADSLYVLDLDMGKEKRQIVTGLKEHYKPIDLEGRKIVIIDNLKPAKIRDVESNGMLLAGTINMEGGKEIIVLLEPPEKSRPGDRVLHMDEKTEELAKIDPIVIKCSIKDVQKSGLQVKNRIVYSPRGPLGTSAGKIMLDLPDNAIIN
ncbi:MAG: methionine--tRNA ligase [Candidatus Woesearchaeota archaeon]